MADQKTATPIKNSKELFVLIAKVYSDVPEKKNGKTDKTPADRQIIRFAAPMTDKVPYGTAQQMGAGENGPLKQAVRALEEKESHEEKTDNNFGRGVSPYSLHGILGC